MHCHVRYEVGFLTTVANKTCVCFGLVASVQLFGDKFCNIWLCSFTDTNTQKHMQFGFHNLPPNITKFFICSFLNITILSFYLAYTHNVDALLLYKHSESSIIKSLNSTTSCLLETTSCDCNLLTVELTHTLRNRHEIVCVCLLCPYLTSKHFIRFQQWFVSGSTINTDLWCLIKGVDTRI